MRDCGRCERYFSIRCSSPGVLHVYHRPDNNTHASALAVFQSIAASLMLLMMKNAPHRRAVLARPPPYSALIPPSLYTIPSAVRAFGYLTPAMSDCAHVLPVSYTHLTLPTIA